MGGRDHLGKGMAGQQKQVVRQKRTKRNAGIKAKYVDERWNQMYYGFCPRPMDFCGPLQGLTMEFNKVPSLLQLWNLFWPKKILIKICKETNSYAMKKRVT